MPIRSIEIICVPCPKCERLKADIARAIKGIEIKYKIKLTYEFKHTPHLRDISRYGLNPSQTPAVLVNGRPEFAGQIQMAALQNKLDSLHRLY